MAQRRMRVIAGPNGSGKSTILTELDPAWVGVYVNADELQLALELGPIDLHEIYGLAVNEEFAIRLRAALGTSPLLVKAGLTGVADRCTFAGTSLAIAAASVNAYVAAALADVLRRELLAAGESFTFETVMSSADKVAFIRQAREAGYRTYLYFVATADPAINVERVQVRVAQGGHDVPEDKIRERYTRSIALLAPACDECDRSYVFDNSGDQHVLLAEIEDGVVMTEHVDAVPAWFAGTALYASFHAPE